MAQSTRTQSGRATRFARTGTGAPAGRFGRASRAPQPGRFSRQTASKPRPRVRGRKSKQQKGGLAATLTGMLPTGAASKATPSSRKGKAGGFAALAAAAGVAFRNRDKLTGMLNRRRGGDESNATTAGTTPTTTPGTTPVGRS
jgi:hypothetical protein